MAPPIRPTRPGPNVRFRPPARPAGMLGRERVSAAIGEAVRENPLTVVSAPSGFGKTTAVADWAAGEDDVA